MIDAAGPDDPRARATLRAALRDVLGVAHVSLFPDARTGLHALLRFVATQRPGAEVILPDYNFFAVPAMVRRAGLTPVFVDVCAPHGEMNLDAAAAAVTSRTAAVLVGHFFGRPNDLTAWARFCELHGLALLEDAAHAFGASMMGRSVGRWGLGGAFSLSLTKGLTGVMGGVVISDDLAAAAWLRGEEREAPAVPRAEVVRAIASALGGHALFGAMSYPAVMRPLQRAARGDVFESLMRERPLLIDPPAVPTYAAMPSACAALAHEHLPRALRDIHTQRARARALITAGPWRRFVTPGWETDRVATHLNLVLRCEDAPGLRQHLLAAGFDTRGDYLTSSTGDARRFPVSVALPTQGVYLPVRSLGDDQSLEGLIACLRAWDAG